MMKFASALLMVAVLLDVVAGHQCQDGSRVTCLAVKQANGAPSSTHGKGARGYPTCSADGKKVFCLFEHSYHHCGSGEEPCCMDGSNPSHHVGDPGDDRPAHPDCSEPAHSPAPVNSIMYAHHAQTEEASPSDYVPTAAPADLTPWHKTAGAIPQRVLDNMDSEVVSEMNNAFEGSYQPCMADAYNGQFHHDWADKKKPASFTFRFAVPQDGCYSIEEYHPGNAWECSRYMPTNARLDIDYCKGLSTSLTINQAVNAAQWNEIAQLPFYLGKEGRITMRNSPEEQCEESGSCFWMVDAFRVTWKGLKCGTTSSGQGFVSPAVPAVPQTKPGQPSQPTVEAMNEGNGADDEVDKSQGTEGLLSLRVNLAHGQDSESLQVMIQTHKAVLEGTLAVHLGYKAVSILHVEESDGRRLTATHGVLLNIRFNAQEKIAEANHNKLKQALMADLTNIAPGLTVEDVSVSWSVVSVGSTGGAKTENNIGAFCFAGSLLLLTVGCILAVFIRKCRMSARSVEVEKVVEAVDCEVVASKDIDDDLEKASKDDQFETASTGTPNSEPQVSEDGANSEGHSKRGEASEEVVIELE